jgi:Tetratricopeptide repeat
MTRDARHQQRAEAAVVIGTMLRPTLLRAARSVFRQDLAGRIHLLIGIDVPEGDAGQLDILRQECPEHVTLTILDLGYSTAQRHGGFYPNIFGGALKTTLSYAANSRYVTYLDDDDWWARDHLSSLRMAIAGRLWAHSYRWMVDRDTAWPICRDEWDSVGIDRGINRAAFGGFACPSTLMIDKEAGHLILPLWSLAQFADGTGDDRLVLRELMRHPPGVSERHSCFYELRQDVRRHAHHAREFAARQLDWMDDRQKIASVIERAEQAGAALARGDIAGAALAARQALAVHPHHAPALFHLAQAEFGAGRLVEARRHAAHARELADYDPAIGSFWATLSG